MARQNSGDMRNLVIAVVLSTVILAFWQYYIEAPRQKAAALALRAKVQTEQQLKKEEISKNEPEVQLARPELLKLSQRVRIESPSLHGSISLTGLRFDDLTLAKYRETLEANSPDVTLFTPAGDEDSYFAQFGWTADDSTLQLPDDKSQWKADGDVLSPEHPVTFTWKNATGVTFTMKAALDEKYMFTLTQSATDASGKALSLHSYAYINRAFEAANHVYRHGKGKFSSGRNATIVQEGPLGAFDGILHESAYKKMKDTQDQKEQQFDAQNGWLGITDIYWFSALIPQDTAFTGHFSYYESKGRDHFQTDFISAAQPQTTVHFFAGAKELALLDGYSAQYHIPLFDRAIDFGMFYFLTKPIFLALNYFHTVVGNFGLAIMLLTVIVKGIMFPLANKSFKSMQAMKVLTPKMNEIRERNKDDKVRLNQEIMELYKREKINPASGCLPMFIQIPVFFALYKVLYVTIEMRQAPFFGWIHDLSVPDPTNLFTLFGVINWTPPAVMHLGIWPIVMCATMVIQQLQSPPPPDPVQAKMMRALPFVFLFMFSNFAAGLVIYWCWSNTLTILQQWYISSSYKSSTQRALNS
jgi:YidC/Oxa1 family membrane protein insertase